MAVSSSNKPYLEGKLNPPPFQEAFEFIDDRKSGQVNKLETSSKEANDVFH
jgi:hypothetical protein